MLSQIKKEKLAIEILRRSYEAINLEDFGSEILPLIDRLFDASTSLLYRFNDEGEMVGIAGAMAEAHCQYAQYYMHDDPMQKPQRHQKTRILHGPQCSEWKAFLDHPAHTECATQCGVDNYLSLRVSDHEMHVPGQVGIILARAASQPDFSKKDKVGIAKLLPALGAVTRRSERLDEKFSSRPFVESIAKTNARPTLVLDHRGGLLWASDRAEALLKPTGHGRSAVPDVLIEAARRLGALCSKDAAFSVPPTGLTLPRKNAQPFQADLRLARTRLGMRYIVVELEDHSSSLSFADPTARFQLTKAEAQVLSLLSMGLSDRKIAGRLFVSLTTIHSHVAHILDKLGVSSRLQAALLAHGLKIQPDSDEE